MDPIEIEGAGPSEPVERALPGEEILMFHEGRLIARLFAYAPRSGKRRELGLLAGEAWIADDFDAPLPDDVLADFEGRH
jgi:antitoxin (DNA-binding transcriptional repressor) of toxin-antitoxin stability system